MWSGQNSVMIEWEVEWRGGEGVGEWRGQTKGVDLRASCEIVRVFSSRRRPK